MKAKVFVRELNSNQYDEHTADFDLLPRIDETISLPDGKKRRYFQVIAVHHLPDASEVEIYAVHTEPSWDTKKPGSIGFSFK